MATLTPEQIKTELARKKSLGKLPTDPNNMAAYKAITPAAQTAKASTGATSGSAGTTTLNAPASAMTNSLPQQPKDPFAAYGGRENYITNQNNRWNAAQSIKDFGTIAKLEADAKRVGYGFTSAADQQNVADFQSYKQRMNDSLAKLEELQNGSSSYDPNTDPKFLAMQQLAKQRAGVASQSAMEALNERGILNSSVTASQLGQIQQDAEQEALSYIPQYEAMARQDYRDRVADALNLYKTYADQEGTAYNRDYTSRRDARGDMVDDRNYNRGVLESDRTFNRNNLESDRNFNRGVLESDRGFNRGVLESDRNFNRGVLESDRNYDQGNSQFWANYNQNADQFNRTLDSKNETEAPKDTYTPAQIGDIITNNFKDSFDKSAWKTPADKQNAASFIIDSVSDANKALQIAKANGITEQEFVEVLKQRAQSNQSGN